jgi:outer membrane murein-binding lipoprotein Lpp
MNKKIVIVVSVLIVAILVVSAFAGTVFYFNGVVNDRNSKIALLNTQIANLNNEITNLSSQMHVFGQANLTSPYLVTALGATEIPINSSANMQNIIISYNHLWISGSVTNTGEGTAFNAGLHVVAYASDGTLEVNMTVPLNNNDVVNFGTDAATESQAYFANGDNNPSFQLVSLGGGGTAVIGINIFHEDTVSNWTITPVWTNIP